MTGKALEALQWDIVGAGGGGGTGSLHHMAKEVPPDRN